MLLWILLADLAFPAARAAQPRESGRDYLFQPDCWGWEIRVERGRVTRLEGVGSCD